MSIAKVSNLRKERKAQVEELKTKIRDIKADQRYSPDYIQEKTSELERQLEEVRSHYDNQITSILEENKNSLTKQFQEAEYKGIEKGQEVQALLKEMRDQEEAEYLFNRYKDKVEALTEETRKLVGANLPSAKAHIKALKKLNILDASILEREYKEKNLNSLQKEVQNSLKTWEEQEKAYKSEKFQDVDPFSSALLGRNHDLRASN